jgi:hypothetical protein
LQAALADVWLHLFGVRVKAFRVPPPGPAHTGRRRAHRGATPSRNGPLLAARLVRPRLGAPGPDSPRT